MRIVELTNTEIKPGPSGKRLCLYAEDINIPLPLEYIEKQVRKYSKISGLYSKAPVVVSGYVPKNRADVDMGVVEKQVQAEIDKIRLIDLDPDFGKNIVYMGGSPYSPLMFIGEAPGESEDYHQSPFVGLAGKKLTEIIEGGMRIPREAVIICNLLKHRPPNNRDPKKEEIEKYEEFLKAQIELFSPKLIIALGKFSANWILQKPQSTSIGSLRGLVHEIDGGIKVVVTYHPSYLIRQYSVRNRRAVLEDMMMATKELEKMDLIPWW